MIRWKQVLFALGILIVQTGTFMISTFIPNTPVLRGQLLDYWVLGIGLVIALFFGTFLISPTIKNSKLRNFSWSLFSLSLLAVSGFFLHALILQASEGFNWGGYA